MRVVRSVAVVCDNCTRAYQRIAAPRTPNTEAQALFDQLLEHARARGWRWHEYLEEDHCPRCAREFMAAS